MLQDEETFFHKIRMLQRRTKCSNFVCDEFVKTFKTCSGVQSSIKKFDKRAKDLAGVNYFVLHGCPGCDRHVYKPEDEELTCPFVKDDGNVCGHARFNASNQPFEVRVFVPFLFLCLSLRRVFIRHTITFTQKVFYYSMEQRIRAFLRIPGFRSLLEHEYTRPRPTNPNVMADVYDGSAWQTFMGPSSSPCNRIGLQGCTDGFQAYVSGTLSLKPWVFSILSLPPALRFKSEFMILLMFLPTNVKGYGQKKYYDFAATFELNRLHHTGIMCLFFHDY